MITKGRKKSTNIEDRRSERKLAPRSDRTGNSKWAAKYMDPAGNNGWAKKRPSRKNTNNTKKPKRIGGGF